MFTDHEAAPAIDRLVADYHRLLDSGRVAVADGEIAGLPAGVHHLGDLEELLLDPATAPGLVDAIWRRLVRRARAEAVWQVVCVGLAAPSLRRLAARIVATTGLDVDDVNSEVVCGFLEAVQTLDLAEPGRFFARLRAAGNAAGMRLVRADRIAACVRLRLAVSAPPPLPCRHPDVVLGRAVAAGVISAGQAELIARTRLEGVGLEAAAGWAGVSPGALRQWRSRAERRLVAWMTGPDYRTADPC